jgi:PH (Pleckstrin Homology) domain-containing protein
MAAGGKAWSARYLYCMAADQATGPKTASGTNKPQVFRSPTAILVWVVWLLFAVANLIDLAVQGRDHTSVVAAGILVMVTGVAYVAAQRPRVIAADDALTVRNPLLDHRIPWTHISRVDVSDLLRVHCRLGGETKVVTAWAVHYSRRRQYSAEAKARRDSLRAAGPRSPRMSSMSQFGIPQSRGVRSPAYGTASQQEVEALKIVRLLNERVSAAGIERATQTSQGTIPADGSAEYSADRAADRAAHQGADRGPGQEIGQVADRSVPADGTPLLTSTWSRRAIAALVIPAVILLICCLI